MENVYYDKKDIYMREIAPLIDEAIRECYDEGVPALAVAAVKNDEHGTEYAGRVVLPSTLGLTIYTDLFSEYPKGVKTLGRKKKAGPSDYNKRIVEPHLDKGGIYTMIAHAEKIGSLAWGYCIPLLFLVATVNENGITQFQGAQMYHKSRNMTLTDDQLTPIILKKVGYAPYDNLEVVAGED